MLHEASEHLTKEREHDGSSGGLHPTVCKFKVNKVVENNTDQAIANSMYKQRSKEISDGVFIYLPLYLILFYFNFFGDSRNELHFSEN